MPQERPNHYGHLLPSNKPRWDGCSGTIHGDSQARVSPRFPDIVEADRRRRARNIRVIAAIFCLAALAAFAVWVLP